MVGRDGRVRRWIADNRTWCRLSGRFHSIDTGPDGRPWGVSADGVLRHGNGLGALAIPGATVFVQAWYRDGATSNTSDALRIHLR